MFVCRDIVFKEYIFLFQKDATISYSSSICHFSIVHDMERLQDHKAVDYELYEEEHSDGTHVGSESVDIVTDRYVDDTHDVDVVLMILMLSLNLKLHVGILLQYLKAFLETVIYLKAFLNQIQVKVKKILMMFMTIQRMMSLIIQNKP